MALALGESRKSEGCEAPIIGAAKAGLLGEGERVAPITLEPKEGGNVLLWRDGDGLPRYAIIGHTQTRDYLKALNVPLRLNHFADCPKARRFKR